MGKLLLVVPRLSSHENGFWKAKDKVHRQRHTRIKVTKCGCKVPARKPLILGLRVLTSRFPFVLD